MPGRKRVPSETQKLKGSYRQGRREPGEPDLVSDTPELMCQGEEKDVVAWFERLAGYLRAENRESKSHEVVLWLAARRAAEIRRLDWDIYTNGRSYWKRGPEGEQLKTNPAVGQKNEAERHLHSLLSELGLTPASKSKVSAAIRPPASDDWGAFEADTPPPAPQRTN